MKPDDHIRRPPKLSPIEKVLAAAEQIKRAISGLRSAVKCLATKTDLTQTEQRIMSKISEYYAAQTAFNNRLDQAITGLTTDVEALNAKITELQNSPGAITPEDQALLDELQTKAEALTAKAEALDALTEQTPEQPPA